MFKIGTYKPASAIEKIIQMLRGGGKPARRESPTGNWSEGAGGTTDKQPPPPPLPRSVSAPRRAPSPAFQEREEYCCLLNSSVSVGFLRRWGGTFGGGYVFFFYPCFSFLNGQLHAREKKIFRGDQSTGFRPLEWASILARESRA